MTPSPVPTRLMLFLSRPGRHRWSSRGGPLHHQVAGANQLPRNPIRALLELCMRAAVAGWLCVQVCPPDRPPLPRPAMSMDHGTASRKPVLEEGVGERGAIIPWYGVGWQITGAKIPRPTPLGFFYLIDSAGRRGKGGGGVAEAGRPWPSPGPAGRPLRPWTSVCSTCVGRAVGRAGGTGGDYRLLSSTFLPTG